MINLPLCDCPKVIFNRGAVTTILESGAYWLNGQYHLLQGAAQYQYATQFPYHRFNRLLNTFYINKKDGSDGLYLNLLENCFVINPYTGDKVYLYIAVCCNHCQLCQERRTSDFNTRCLLESSTSETLPIMVTLTYDKYSIPFEKLVTEVIVNPQKSEETKEFSYYEKIRSPYLRFSKNPKFIGFEKSDTSILVETSKGCQIYDFGCPCRPCLDVRDTQKFLKRLRRFWEIYDIHPDRDSKGNVIHSYEEWRDLYPFRYVICGEKGKNHSRPHYHCILYNVPYQLYNQISDIAYLQELKSDIVKNWQNSTPTIEGTRNLLNGSVKTCLFGSDSLQCEIARDAGSYVGKYVGKDKGNGETTFQSSMLGGGLGSRAIDDYKPFIYAHPEIQVIRFKDRNGALVEKRLGRYAHRRLFPSIISLIPTEYKKQHRYFINELSDINGVYSRYGCDRFDYLQSLVTKYSCPFLPQYLGIPLTSTVKSHVSCYTYIEDGNIVKCVYNKPQFVKYPYEIEEMEDDLMYCQLKERKIIADMVEAREKYKVDFAALLKQMKINSLHAKSMETTEVYRGVDTVRIASQKAISRKKEIDLKLLF